MSSMSSTGEYTFTDLNGEACSPDFATYARACGADGYAIGSPEELASALGKALVARRPPMCFLGLNSPTTSVAVSTRGHRDRAASMVAVHDCNRYG